MDPAPTEYNALRHSGAALSKETTVIVLALAIFATYRIATDLAWEGGPFGVYEHLRGAIIQRYKVEHWLSDGVTCPICISFWVALPIALLLGVYGAYDAWLWPLSWLGIAGAAAFLARVTT